MRLMEPALEGAGVWIVIPCYKVRDHILNVLAKVPAWIDTVGAAGLINTRSTTWRNLSAEDKLIAEDDPAGLLISHPTLIKRPVIERAEGVTIGWNADVRSRILGDAG